MAAAGGILAASRLLAVNQSSGGSDLLLLAIAGPVIAGASLFGGRGSVWGALLGALVIGSISNGMDLLALESSVKFMVTGGGPARRRRRSTRSRAATVWSTAEPESSGAGAACRRPSRPAGRPQRTRHVDVRPSAVDARKRPPPRRGRSRLK